MKQRKRNDFAQYQYYLGEYQFYGNQGENPQIKKCGPTHSSVANKTMLITNLMLIKKLARKVLLLIVKITKF
jgi:hypothetical protein